MQPVESDLVQSIGDLTLVGNRSENFIPSDGKTFDHGAEDSDVFDFVDEEDSEQGKSNCFYTLDSSLSLLQLQHFQAPLTFSSLTKISVF